MEILNQISFQYQSNAEEFKKKKKNNKEHTITMAGPVYFNLFATETLFKLENIRFLVFYSSYSYRCLTKIVKEASHQDSLQAQDLLKSYDNA